jgi:hypothetical protein
MYSLPVLLAFLCVIGLVLKFSTVAPKASLKGIKNIQNKLRGARGGGGGAYLDMDDEDDQHHAAEGLRNLDFLSVTAAGTGAGAGATAGGAKKKTLEDPFNFGHRGESKSYTPLFSPERKRSSVAASPPTTPPASLPSQPASSEFADFADFADFVTVGFDS